MAPITTPKAPKRTPQRGSPTMKNKAPTEFTCFSKLPIELRYKIWEEAASIPRIVELHSRSIVYYQGPAILRVVELIRSTTPIPAMLQTDRESRTQAMKHYKLSFCLPGNDTQRIYINFTVNTVLINFWRPYHSDYQCIIGLLPEEDKAKIQHIAFCLTLVPWKGWLAWGHVAELRTLVHLPNVTRIFVYKGRVKQCSTNFFEYTLNDGYVVGNLVSDELRGKDIPPTSKCFSCGIVS